MYLTFLVSTGRSTGRVGAGRITAFTPICDNLKTLAYFFKLLRVPHD